jgi:DNA-binding transcriptional ArsR family regulator
VLTYLTDGSAGAWTALGDATRREIFARLAERPRAVGALASELPVSRPAVSQHLKVLRDAGLVHATREGKQHIYQVDRDGLGALRADLERFWDTTMAAYKAAVEQPTTPIKEGR